jgi:very-short-patch-repair endonuclease
VLACGPGAVLSHRAAAALLGLSRNGGRWPAVTRPGRAPQRRPGIDVHGSRALTLADTRREDGIPCTSPARTLLDLAEVTGPAELTRAIERAEELRIFDGRAVEEVLARANGRRGGARLTAALQAWAEPAFTRSEAERRLLRRIHEAGLPAPMVNRWVAGYEVDMYWPAARLVVEIDGFEFHRSRPAFEADRARDADLGDAGIRVLRVTWRQITHDVQTLLARIARAASL